MIQITLTQKQLELVKDAIDSFDSGFFETEQECQDFNHLKNFIDYKVNETKGTSALSEIEQRIAMYRATAQQRQQLYGKGE